MANIIESFLLEIAIDPAGVKKGADEVSVIHKKTTAESIQIAKEMEERGKQAGGFFKSLKEEAGGFFSVLAGAYSAQKIAGMTKDIMLNSESVGYLAQNLGMSTERLSAWGMAAEKNGGSAAAMTAQLQAAAAAVSATKLGREFQGQEAFFSLGGKIEDLKTTESYLAAISRILAPYFAPGGDSAQGINMANWLGINPGAINLLKQGETSVAALVKEQEKYAAISKQQADGFHETLNNFRDLSDSLKVIGHTLVEAVNPQLKEMVGYIKIVADFSREHKADIKKETPSILSSGSGAAIGRAAAVTGKTALGRIGGVASDLFMPQSTATDEQEQAELRKFYAEKKSTATGSQKERLEALEEMNGLPPGSLDAVWLQESSRGKNMLSPAGAKGHFGFMDRTWAAYGQGGDPNNFEDSSLAAAKYLKDLMKQHGGDFDASLRWYNAGKNFNGLQAHKYADEVQGNMQAGSTNTTSTQISVNGPINIQSQTDNPDRLAGDLVQKLQSYSTISSQADTGTH